MVTVSVSGELKAQPPKRIVSTNLCTDQFVLALADRDEIAGVSRAGQDQYYSPLAAKAGGLPSHRGGAEEIVMMRPDLVVAGAYTRRDTVYLLDRLSVPVLNIPSVDRIKDLFPQIKRVADAIDHSGRGEALSKRLLEKYQDFVASEELATGALYRPGGYTVGGQSIVDDVMKVAGLGNAGADLGISGEGRLALEQLVMSPPDFLIIDSLRPDRPSLSRQILEHPALAKLPDVNSTLQFPVRYWLCATPSTIEGASLLAKLVRQKLSIGDQRAEP